MSSYDKCVLCLDPDSEHFYLYNLNSNQVILLKQVPANIRENAKNTIKNLRELCEQQEIKFASKALTKKTEVVWNFSTTTATSYQRRKLPFYLLHKDYSMHPQYIHNSNLSLAFAIESEDENEYEENSMKTTFRIKIDIRDYNSQLVDGGDEKEYRRANEAEQVVFELDVLMISSGDHIIKVLLKEIFKEYNKKLLPKEPDKKFVLKTKGLKEYIMGTSPLLSYEQVRQCLRHSKPFECILTEILKTVTHDPSFPPILTIPSSARVFSEVEESDDDIENDIDWEQFENRALFLWYPPCRVQHASNMTVIDPIEKYIKRKFYEKKQTIKPRALNHLMMDNFLEKRMKRLKEHKIELGKSRTSYTGECDFPFRIKINGLDNVIGLVKQFLANATINGLVEPDYVTLKNFRRVVTEEAAGVHKKKEPKKKKKLTQKAPSLPKEKKTHSLPENYDIYDDSLYNQALNLDWATHYGKLSIPMLNITEIIGLPFVPYMVTCEVKLLYGITLLREDLKVETSVKPFSNNPRWFEWIEFPNLRISQLPLETKIAMNIKIYSQKGERLVIGSAQKILFDEKGHFPSSFNQLNIWPFYKVDPRLSCMSEYNGQISRSDGRIDNEYTTLSFEFDNFDGNMVYSLRDQSIMDLKGMPNIKTKEEKKFHSKIDETPDYAELALCNLLLGYNPLKWDEFNQEEKQVLLKCRNHLSTLSSALPIFLCAINWLDPDQRKIAHEMIRKWGLITPEDALCLLDAPFADEMVRLYAVQRLSTMTDDTLSLFMPELVIALVYEQHHYSPLAELLVERSLKNKSVVGHEFFWLTRSQFHLKIPLERYMVIIEAFIMLCGYYRNDLLTELTVNNFLYTVQKEVSEEARSKNLELKNKIELCKKKFREHKTIPGTSAYPLPEKFALPHDSRIETTDFVYDKIKMMNSKKEPLWVELFNSVPGSPEMIFMFKSGDDLRQDILTLQLIRVMDKMWLDNGLDYKMRPYRVMATMDQVGFIEIVTESETTAIIHTKYGGKMGALKENTIAKFINEHNKGAKYFKAREIFKRSCAGYCIATYLLGIGDRHSDNIMVSKEGHLFHIDFGHFLGAFKKMMGLNREQSAFVFQKEMAYVIGMKSPDEYEEFLKRCLAAYNIVRKNSSIIVNIFMMMISAGLPELKKKRISYLLKHLALECSEQEAGEKFKIELNNSLNNTWRSIDNFFHNIKRQ